MVRRLQCERPLLEVALQCKTTGDFHWDVGAITFFSLCCLMLWFWLLISYFLFYFVVLSSCVLSLSTCCCSLCSVSPLCSCAPPAWHVFPDYFLKVLWFVLTFFLYYFGIFLCLPFFFLPDLVACHFIARTFGLGFLYIFFNRVAQNIILSWPSVFCAWT